MDVVATTAIVAGSRVSLEISGALPVYLPDATFREALANQMRMAGFNVETLSISSAYGFTSRDYTGKAVITTLAPSRVSSVIALMSSAAENAGSYTPNVSVPSVGQAAQPELDRGVIGQTVEDLFTSIGVAAKGVAGAPEQLFSTTKLIIVGIVVLGALIAFGPNLRGIGRAVR